MSWSWTAILFAGVIGSGATTASCGARDDAQTPVAAGDRSDAEAPDAAGSRLQAPPSPRAARLPQAEASADASDDAEPGAKPEREQPRAPDSARDSKPSGAGASPSPTALEKARGLSRAEVREEFGDPNRKGADRWIYVLPTGQCAAIRRIYTLRFEHERVVDVEIGRERTGQHCEPHSMP